jgi:hypothetical protein
VAKSRWKNSFATEFVVCCGGGSGRLEDICFGDETVRLRADICEETRRAAGDMGGVPVLPFKDDWEDFFRTAVSASTPADS